ncbi:hypothetical protein [Pseudozobellia sp. WGM2]|uniref:hypothetical protein n=1 Tax=Pseudozobellia sp. WGM2 TaxID=2787625 RepID=UPI001AE04CF7|nr:hypothetical protein [Pseudozobellia sp. WGM2]
MKKHIKVGSTKLTVKISWLLILLVFVALSCKGQKNKPNQILGKSDLAKSTLTLLSRDYIDSTSVERVLVIRDFKSLQKLYSKINSTRKPGLPLLKVDFSTNMLLFYRHRNFNANTTSQLVLSKSTQDSLILIERENDFIRESSSTMLVPFSIYLLNKMDKKVVIK